MRRLCTTLVKVKGPVLVIALLHDKHMLQERFTISEVAADRHELMISQRIMRASEQLYPRCSMQTYHHPNQI